MLHLLYARFWHKVLFDLGWSTQEPFQRLVNQGYIRPTPTPTRAASTCRQPRCAEADGTLVRGEPVNVATGRWASP